MKLTRARVCTGFTLVEALVSMCIVGIGAGSLCTGILFAFRVQENAHEELRAAEIIEEKFEYIRLLNWDQVSAKEHVPASFKETYSTGSPGVELTYDGSIQIHDPKLVESYSDGLMLVTIDLKWKSGSSWKSARGQTFVSQYGLQNYTY